MLAVRYNQQVNPPPAPLSTFVATANDLQHLRSWLGRAYPVADVVWSSGTIDANMQGPNFTAGDINAQLAAIRAQDVAPGVDKRTHYYGMVADGGFFMRGFAPGIPGRHLTRASLHPGQPALIHGGGTSTARTATGTVAMSLATRSDGSILVRVAVNQATIRTIRTFSVSLPTMTLDASASMSETPLSGLP